VSPVFPVKPRHEHRFKLVTHMDGCHWYSSEYVCDCGAGVSTYDERELALDPYCFMWLDENCTRCAELAGGAETKHEQERHERE
jgi:hypothetical protein